MSLITKALGIDLVDILRARRTRREPAVFSNHLQAANRRAVAGRVRQLGNNWFTGELRRLDGIRGQRFKYARYFEIDPVYEELYDLQQDPLEMTNLVEDPNYADELNRLRLRTDELRDLYGGPYVPHEGEPAMLP